MNDYIVVARCQHIGALLCICLIAACNGPEPEAAKPKDQKSVPSAEPETAVAPSVRPESTPERSSTREPIAIERLAPKGSPSAESPVTSKNDSAATAGELDLKSIVAPLFSPELFKLDPTKTQAYFASIAALQLQPSDESWEKTYEGTSPLPWVEAVHVRLDEQNGRWGLGQTQVTWRPPKAQARALYDRLVAEVKSARGRKPDFGRNESKGSKQQRHVGWSWCKDTCQAIVALESSGQTSLAQPSAIDEDHPVVQLTVFTPDGP